MKKCLMAAFCTAVLLTQIVTIEGYALESQLLPVEEGITLLDTSGKIYIHVQNKSTVNVTVDKTEPEGVFRYYNESLSNEEQTSDKISSKVYKMELSCCEYLVDSGEYASYYTLKVVSPLDKNSSYSQNIVIKDPGFENTSSSEYHFYITMKPSDDSGYKILSSSESTSRDGIFVSKQYMELAYSNAGDINGNGKLDISDATDVLTIYARQAAGLDTDEFTSEQKKAADINGDGKIDISDATEILNIYAKNAADLE